MDAVLFDWDAANVSHIAEHAITTVEAEEVILNAPLDMGQQQRKGEDRLLQVGETKAGRILIVVTTIRNTKVRVVTAFPANRAYRDFYATQKGRDIDAK